MAVPLSCFAVYAIWNIITLTYFKIPEFTIRSKYKKQLKSFVCISILVIFLLVFIQPFANNLNKMYTAYSNNPVTINDIVAFQWIEGKYPQKCKHSLAFDADAGQWIPVFTGRRIFPYGPLITNPVVLNDMQTLISEIYKNASSPLVLDLINKYQINYIYFGSKKIYGLSTLSIYLFLNDTKNYELVYQD